MTLLINDEVTPRVYAKQVPKASSSNQTMYRQSYLTDFIQHQQEVNKQMTDSLEHIKKGQTSLQSVAQRLNRMEEQYNALVKKIDTEGLVHQAVIDEVTAQHQYTRQIATNMRQLEVTQTDFLRQQQTQNELFDEISKHLAIQEAFHETIFQSLDKQQATTESIASQLAKLKDLISDKITHFVMKKTKKAR